MFTAQSGQNRHVEIYLQRQNCPRRALTFTCPRIPFSEVAYLASSYLEAPDKKYESISNILWLTCSTKSPSRCWAHCSTHPSVLPQNCRAQLSADKLTTLSDPAQSKPTWQWINFKPLLYTVFSTFLISVKLYCSKHFLFNVRKSAA